LHRRIEYGLVWLLLVCGLGLGSQHAGVAWDEVTYFDFSDHVRDWWQSGAPLDAAALEHAWAYNRYLNPHPPLMRALSAATAALPLPFPTNYRLATLLLCAALLTSMYALLRPSTRPLVAALALAAVALQPRVYGDMLNATCDAPVALAFSVLCLLGWRIAAAPSPERRPLRAALYLTYGVATAIKFTGFLAIAPVAVYFGWRRQPREVLWALGSVGWALLFLLITSPDRWHAPLAGIVDYLTYPFTRSAVPISTLYLGESYPFALPWHYADVMTALTVPLPVLCALPLVGFVTARYREPSIALLFPLGFWLLLVHLPSTPRHDGVRQFLAVMPLLGLLASFGFASLIERMRAAAPRLELPTLTTAGLALALTFVPWLRVPLSSYNALAGGLPGAAAMGLETTYFLEVVSPDFVARMNHVLHSGDSVMLLPEWPGLLRRYQAEGFLRKDVAVVDNFGAQPRFLLLVRRRSVVKDEMFLRMPAVLETSHDDVVLAKLTRIGR
jgi:4-amino-4-deoxy-L-arabinose transferase-like glycosyltransferase